MGAELWGRSRTSHQRGSTGTGLESGRAQHIKRPAVWDQRGVAHSVEPWSRKAGKAPVEEGWQRQVEDLGMSFKVGTEGSITLRLDPNLQMT